MIGDLCKPLNPGETNTVRIIMQIGEAQRLLAELNRIAAGPEVAELKRILEHAVEREEALEDDRLAVEAPAFVGTVDELEAALAAEDLPR
jgi:hypothetical protein